MHTKKSKLRALALGVCLLVTLALGGIVANADDAVGENTLTVYKTGSSSEAFPTAVKTDYLGTTVEVELYQIASATKNKTYDIYDYASVVDGLDLEDSALKDDTGATDWEKVAQAAKSLVDSGDLKNPKTLTIEAGAESANLSSLPDGLFLVLPKATRGTNFEYSFNPSVTALPTKAAKDESGTIMTSFDYGKWLKSVEIKLKPGYMPLYGALEITKTVNKESEEDSTFVFHLTGKTPQNENYDNYAGITIPAGERTGSTVVDHIPAGTTITIVEDYAGRYNKGPVTIASGEENVIIADKDDGSHNLIHFSCENTKGNEIPGSHGVENNFRFVEKKDGEDYKKWENTATPSDKKTNGSEN